MIFKLIATTLILTSCSSIFKIKRRHEKSHPDIDKVRKILVERSDGALGDSEIITGFVDSFDRPGVVGTCDLVISENFSPEIDIHKDSWYSYTEDMRLVLLAHEYGHCQCKFFDHRNEVDSVGCSSHYMSANLPSRWCLNRNFKKYIEQFKKGCEGISSYD